jgi:hypothetical protein
MLKKLMTVAKSKYYMLKINMPHVFDPLELEISDGSYDNSIPAVTRSHEIEESRLHLDLKRGQHLS